MSAELSAAYDPGWLKRHLGTTLRAMQLLQGWLRSHCIVCQILGKSLAESDVFD